MTALRLNASSQAEEAGFRAMRDSVAVADDLDIEYRIIGGQMVGLHVALAGVAELVIWPSRWGTMLVKRGARTVSMTLVGYEPTEHVLF